MSLSVILDRPFMPAAPPCHGKVIRASRTTVYARLPHASLGDLCTIVGDTPTQAQVIAFNGDTVALAPFDHMNGLRVGAPVLNQGQTLTLNERVITPGSIVDACGESMRSSPIRATSYQTASRIDLLQSPPPALERTPISDILTTGIRSIDTLFPIGYGQRIGIFAPPGVGKSSLLGTLAARAAVDVSVIGLIGERGREVNDFINDCLGMVGLRRTILVVSTGDETALRRATAPHTATRIAEYYRAQGKRVLLLIDSLTRYARALRDLGLAAGEPPLSQGLTPSLYTELPRLLERAGTNATGSITALYTVLSTESNGNDLLAEEVKSLLDGHIVLSPRTRLMGFQPPIDPTSSISRLASRISKPETQQHAATVVAAISRLLNDRDIVTFGGTPDPLLARALLHEDDIVRFMRQAREEPKSLAETQEHLAHLARLLTTEAND